MRVVVAVVRSDDLLAVLLCFTATSLSYDDILLVRDDQDLYVAVCREARQHARQTAHLVHVESGVDLVRQQDGTRLLLRASQRFYEHDVDGEHEGQQTQRLLPSREVRVEGPGRVIQLALHSQSRKHTYTKRDALGEGGIVVGRDLDVAVAVALSNKEEGDRISKT